jgi:hypothetical protein
MYLLRILAALLLTAFAAGGTAAQAPPLLPLSSGGMERPSWSWSRDHIAFVLTESGARAIQERLARPHPAKDGDRWVERFTRAGAADGIRGMRMRFDRATCAR